MASRDFGGNRRFDRVVPFKFFGICFGLCRRGIRLTTEKTGKICAVALYFDMCLSCDRFDFYDYRYGGVDLNERHEANGYNLRIENDDKIKMTMPR